MRLIFATILLIASCAEITPQVENSERPLVKFEPPAGKVLVFVGQDNASVGGSEKWSEGYVDHFGVPAGITHYVYFTKDIVKAISYINADWDADPMWHGRDWGNTRMQDNQDVARHWREKMSEHLYVHGVDGTYDMIGFAAD